MPYIRTYINEFWTVFENSPKYAKLHTYRYRYNVLSILLLILLGLASQIKIFDEAPPNSKGELKIVLFVTFFLCPFQFSSFFVLKGKITIFSNKQHVLKYTL